FLPASRPLPPLHSFPTRRSSDLSLRLMFATALAGGALAVVFIVASGRILETLRNTLGVVAFHAQHGLQSHPVVNLDNPGAVRMPYGLAFAAGTLFWAISTQLWR